MQASGQMQKKWTENYVKIKWCLWLIEERFSGNGDMSLYPRPSCYWMFWLNTHSPQKRLSDLSQCLYKVTLLRKVQPLGRRVLQNFHAVPHWWLRSEPQGCLPPRVTDTLTMAHHSIDIRVSKTTLCFLETLSFSQSCNFHLSSV